MSARREFCELLRSALLATERKSVLQVVAGGDFDRPVEFTGRSLIARAEDLSSQFSTRERDVVLLLLPHSPELFLLQLGLILGGRIPGILAWPTSRVDPDKYQRNLVHQLGSLPADLLITLPRLAKNMAGALPYPVAAAAIEGASGFEKMFPTGIVSERLQQQEIRSNAARAREDELFLQFSGGTTGAQKAIVVTVAMLSAQLASLGQALQFTHQDCVVSWLPLYHDMGLVAGYWLPLWHGASSVQLSANDWVMNPELFLSYVDRAKGTFCWLPNFAFSYLSQRRELMRATHRLGSMRGWINCSEPVRARSIEEFARTFADWGVRSESLQTSYAMAETVFAISQSRLGTEPPTVKRAAVNRGKQSHYELAFDVVDELYVSSGRPLADTEVSVRAEDGSACPERSAGEIHVRTPSLFAGYWGVHGFQKQTLKDGWHATGDYGFVSDGEVYVIGRFKDIVMVGGNNVFPEDVEAVVNAIDGIYRGRVVAFGLEDQNYGTESLAIVAETRGEPDEGAASRLEAAIRKSVLTNIGIAPRHVAVVPQRWIVKSTAGKISRRETRERFLREKLATGL